MKKFSPRKKRFARTLAPLVAIPVATYALLFTTGAPAYADDTPATGGQSQTMTLDDQNYSISPFIDLNQFSDQDTGAWLKWQHKQVNIVKAIKAQRALDALHAATDDAAAARTKLLTDAMQYRDVVPYVFGGETPNGWDCSGFTMYVYNEALGIQIPHSVNAQSVLGKQVKREDAQAGDLVIFSNKDESNFHVGIYLGDGLMIHAPYPGVKTRFGNVDWDPDNTLVFVNLIDPDQAHDYKNPYYTYDTATGKATTTYDR